MAEKPALRGVRVQAVKRIHVNQKAISANAQDQGTRPILFVYDGDVVEELRELEIVADGKVVASIRYQPDEPLRGARCWIETNETVRAIE